MPPSSTIKVSLLLPIGQDTDGDALFKELEGKGLDLSKIQRNTDLPTGTVEIDESSLNDPKYDIKTDVAWSEIREFDGMHELAAKCDAVLYGSLSRVTPRLCRSTNSQTVAVHEHLDGGGVKDAVEKGEKVADGTQADGPLTGLEVLTGPTGPLWWQGELKNDEVDRPLRLPGHEAVHRHCREDEGRCHETIR